MTGLRTIKTVNSIRANGGVIVSLAFRLERVDSFSRLRKSAMFERRGADGTPRLVLFGNCMGVRRGRDLIRSLFLACNHPLYTYWFWLTIDSALLSNVRVFSFKGLTLDRVPKRGRKAHHPRFYADPRALPR